MNRPRLASLLTALMAGLGPTLALLPAAAAGTPPYGLSINPHLTVEYNHPTPVDVYVFLNSDHSAGVGINVTGRYAEAPGFATYEGTSDAYGHLVLTISGPPGGDRHYNLTLTGTDPQGEVAFEPQTSDVYVPRYADGTGSGPAPTTSGLSPTMARVMLAGAVLGGVGGAIGVLVSRSRAARKRAPPTRGELGWPDLPPQPPRAALPELPSQPSSARPTQALIDSGVRPPQDHTTASIRPGSKQGP